MNTQRVLGRRGMVWAAMAAGAAALMACASGVAGGRAAAVDSGAAGSMRIGTYDSRAVGLAYGRSTGALREVSSLHTEHEKAVKAGNEALARKLEKQGISLQIRRHLQVFSDAPVGDAISTVKARLPEVATKMNVAAIVSRVEFVGEGVEAVDVTDEIVLLFEPSVETLKMIADVRKRAPAPIEDVAQMPVGK